MGSRAAPGKSGLHARGEGERVLAPAGATEDEVLGYRLQFGREDSSPLV